MLPFLRQRIFRKETDEVLKTRLSKSGETPHTKEQVKVRDL